MNHQKIKLGIIIKHRKHYLTRLTLWLIVIVFIGLSPILIGFLGAWITELSTGEPCHEGNCNWMVLPWMGMITIPISGLGLLLFLIIILIDSISLKKQQHKHN